MLEKNNRYKVLKVFMDASLTEFGLRELSRLANLSPPSVLTYLKEFEKKELIVTLTKKGKPWYKAQRENKDFIFYKKLSVLYELNHSGLIDYLWEHLAPKAIILYGSSAKGESIEGSDIDLFIIGKEKKIILDTYQKKLGKHVHLLFDEQVQNIPAALKNNLINGIVLRGYFQAFT
jgi:predicted nucleotidyltransferase